MANYVPRLKEKYLKEIRTGLKEKFSYKTLVECTFSKKNLSHWQSEYEIDYWLKTKRAMLRTINTKVDYNSYKEETLR